MDTASALPLLLFCQLLKVLVFDLSAYPSLLLTESFLDPFDDLFIADARGGGNPIDLKGSVRVSNHNLHARFRFSLYVVFASTHCVGAGVFRTFPVVDLELERSEVLVPSR